MDHQQLIEQQFGDRAQAYLDSEVHAQGAELQMLAGIVREHPVAQVLDLGCGGGHVSFSVAPWADSVIAYDLSESMLSTVRSAATARGFANVKVQQGAAERLPFADDSFDFVFSRYSAHHWSDPAAALREVRRVLRPQGEAIFVDVVSPGVAVLDTHLQSIEVLRDASHVRDYSVNEWLSFITSAGLIASGHSMQRLRLDFASWTARMRTPELLRQAIRALQGAVGEEVRRYFEIEIDGSFSADVAVLRSRK
ncbi:Methyltransferase domain-containing protein [Halopseudomonas xinjiangensis]|uniref:Methyltransferase domain-containing protein n=1 Tax=Halopseudomonas xinjiangensis TaxID=487184 RepID=A0A1H1PSH4_9GAMM|nr:class I SAM-dependent methyltransferase [Halopseudomonas xinjiangensis]SDS14128.1 Methyltransferase domain-containing protein [Halopseudomonas xinjiangensis]